MGMVAMEGFDRYSLPSGLHWAVWDYVEEKVKFTLGVSEGVYGIVYL
jgi:hypothetical protein